MEKGNEYVLNDFLNFYNTDRIHKHVIVWYSS